MENFDFSMALMISALLLLCSSAVAQKFARPPTFSPTPAPAPAPFLVNLTELLTVAGPYQKFLNYLETTKVIQTFQNQANNTSEGITIFVPEDDAFRSLKKQPSLANLTQDQLRQLCLFHALPHYYSLSDFKNLSRLSPVGTFAGGPYTLNFTDISGTVHLDSGWTRTTISSSVLSTNPVAVYQVDSVILPEAIFGTDIPPMPAPAPAPAASDLVPPAADAPGEASDDDSAASPGSSPGKSSSHRNIIINYWGIIWSLLIFAVSGWMVLFL